MEKRLLSGEGMNHATLELHAIADSLYEAETKRIPIEPLSDKHNLSLDAAYQVQMMNAARCLKQGKKLVGYKIGLTSLEAQKHFNLTHPDFGHLFDTMVIDGDSELDLNELISPKIEGEIAFVLGRDLQGPGITVAEAIRSVDSVMGAFEIIDSRIRDWKIKASDTIADNGSSARVVLTGKPTSLKHLDLPHVGMALSKNGEVTLTACGAAVMGNPLNALVFLANELGNHGRSLLAGEVILSGSLGGMIAMKPNENYTAEFLKLGRVDIRTKGEAAC